MTTVKRILREAQARVDGTFPDGKIRSDDGGALYIAVGLEGGNVTIVMAHPTDWLAFPPNMARDLAKGLVQRADEADGILAQAQPEPDRWELYAGGHLFTVCYSREDLEKSKDNPYITNIVELYTAPPSTALLIAEREAQLSEARQATIKEGLARDAAEKRVGELEEKLAVLLAIQRKILASETAPATPAPVAATSGHLR